MAGLRGILRRGILRRGILNTIRSPIRTLLLIGLLAISIGLAGSMLAVNGAVGQRIQEVRAAEAPQITLRPAGAFGFFGGGEPLLEEDLAPVANLPHVIGIEKTAQGQYAGSALVSAIDPGTLGRRFGGGGSVGGGTGTFTMTMPIIVTGIEPGSQGTLLGGGTAQVVAGRPLEPEDADSNVALLGQTLAERNSLQVGSTFDWEGTPVEVIGLFQTGQRFGDNMVILPFNTAQRLLGLEGEVSQAIVHIDSASNLSTVSQAIIDALGSDRVDVISDAERLSRVTDSLEGAQNTTSIGMFSGLGAGAAVILVAMALVVRERRREIGILKAIGASNRQVVLQFIAESLVIAVIAVVVGLLVAQFTVKPVAAQTLPDTQPQVVSVGGEQRIAGFSGGGFAFRESPGFGGGQLFGLANIEANLTVGSGLFTAGSGITIALLTTLTSSWIIARVKPAEVLRSE